VTITGFFKGGFESLKYGNSVKANASQHGVVDDSSRIIFNVREDLGGALRPSANSTRASRSIRATSRDGNNHVAW